MAKIKNLFGNRDFLNVGTLLIGFTGLVLAALTEKANEKHVDEEIERRVNEALSEE